MIMVIAGRGRRTTISVDGWTEQEIEGARLAVEIDGYEAFVRKAVA
jgi:hypothetical protein